MAKLTKHPFVATPNFGTCSSCGRSRFDPIHKMDPTPQYDVRQAILTLLASKDPELVRMIDIQINVSGTKPDIVQALFALRDAGRVIDYPPAPGDVYKRWGLKKEA